jgi:hypothetical protein
MLGVLEMDIQTCINKYLEIMDYVFSGPRLPISWRMDVVSRFDKGRLRDKIIEVIRESTLCRQSGIRPDQLLLRRPGQTPRCRV